MKQFHTKEFPIYENGHNADISKAIDEWLNSFFNPDLMMCQQRVVKVASQIFIEKTNVVVVTIEVWYSEGK